MIISLERSKIMNKEELALKLTELKYKNYTYGDYCYSTCRNILEFYESAIKTIEEKGWLDE